MIDHGLDGSCALFEPGDGEVRLTTTKRFKVIARLIDVAKSED
jgi:hypothetical protein